jgi:prevent-host-death family protein
VKDDRTVSASRLKATVSDVLDVVAGSGIRVIITRRGRAVAMLVPVRDPRAPGRTLFGSCRGSVVVHGDIVEPVDVEWDAVQ